LLKASCVDAFTFKPGRPLRNPLGVFTVFIIMRTKGVRSLRELIKLLDVDTRLRKLCLIKAVGAGYPKVVLSSFIRKDEEDNLNGILEKKIV
jgi:hypothetical protein